MSGMTLPPLPLILHKTDSRTQQVLSLIVCDKLFVMNQNALSLDLPALCYMQAVLHITAARSERGSSATIAGLNKGKLLLLIQREKK